MKNKSKEERVIYLNLNKKELDFLNKIFYGKDVNIAHSIIFNHFFSLCKNLSLDINGVKTKRTLKKEILNALEKY